MNVNPFQNPPFTPFFNFTNIKILAGLWEVCLNGFHDKGHQWDTKFYGCKHILLEEYDIIRDEIMPRKYHHYSLIIKKSLQWLHHLY